jgi:quercetin dioxygenase-like cupin family protein
MTRGPHLVDPRTVESVSALGPTIQFLTAPNGNEDGPCVMRGIIPASTVVPLHSHADPETFLVLSGSAEGLVDRDRCKWQHVGPGNVFHVPPDAPHAWRNFAADPAVMLFVGTNRLARFFTETAAEPERFLEISERYGYWNATPEENAKIGVPLAH